MLKDVDVSCTADRQVKPRRTVFCGGVMSQHSHTLDGSEGRVLDDPTTDPARVHVPHEPHRFPRDVCGAPEVGLKHCACILIAHKLDLTNQDSPRVVEDDVQPTERLLDCGKCLANVFRIGDVELEHEQAVGGVLGG